jgi:hypothetical protein
MINFPTKQLILEGPDLVGKTTVYNKLHQSTNFKWNIQDRSTLSMLCYARLYKRDEKLYRERLCEELNDLNNRMIILLPPFSVIEKRYHARGDEIQDLTSLQLLHNIFSEEAKLIEKKPTVMCLREEISVNTVLNYTSEWSFAIESSKPFHVGEIIRDTLLADKSDELTLRARMCYKTSLPNKHILENNLEGEYYSGIKATLCQTIKNEIDGINPYDKPQTMESRRFFYNSDTCISTIHLMPRQSTLKVYVCLRSTDVVKNASIDLSFLEFLTHFINQEFKFGCDCVILDVTLNSAHVRRDLEE